jgi:hypothetical protein
VQRIVHLSFRGPLHVRQRGIMRLENLIRGRRWRHSSWVQEYCLLGAVFVWWGEGAKIISQLLMRRECEILGWPQIEPNFKSRSSQLPCQKISWFAWQRFFNGEWIVNGDILYGSDLSNKPMVQNLILHIQRRLSQHSQLLLRTNSCCQHLAEELIPSKTLKEIFLNRRVAWFCTQAQAHFVLMYSIYALWEMHAALSCTLFLLHPWIVWF